MKNPHQQQFRSRPLRSGNGWQSTKQAAVLAGWMCLCTSAFGQESVTLQSKDGQIIKGSIIKQENGTITIKSDTFGQIEVSESKVKIVKDKAEPTTSQHNGAVVPSAPPKAEQTQAGSHPLKDKTREWLHMPDNMTLHAAGGLGYMEGHQTLADSYSASLELNYETTRYKNKVTGAYQYSKANGNLTSDNYNASARTYRYFGKEKISPYYAKFKLIQSGDKVHFVDSQSEVLVGLGMDIHKSDKLSVNMSIGYDSEWEDFATTPTAADPGVEHRSKAFIHEEISLNLTSKLSLQHEGYFMLEHEDELEVRLSNGLKYQLTDHLSLDLNHSFNFDETSAGGIDKDVTQINLQLGYSL